MTAETSPMEGTPLIRPSSTDHALYDQIVEACRTVYDPEIPVNIFDLGLIYTIEINDENAVRVQMTLTAPGCPVAGDMPGWVAEAIEPLPGVKQVDVDRVQEFRKCIECFLCQDTCHVIRDHDKQDAFVGPRFMIRLASLDMHPLDTADRIPATKNEYGSGMCNITRCCTEVCPEHINITDNGIIPMKERVVDRFYDPIAMVLRSVFGGK